MSGARVDVRDEMTSLAAVAGLLGRLFVSEVDAATLATLRDRDVAAALARLGLEVPLGGEGEEDDGDDRARLDALAEDFLESVLRPREGAPLVQSLWAEGRFEGEAAVAMRRVARAAGYTFERERARGLPLDHLGCQLMFWADLAPRAPDLAAHVAREHLAWASRPLTVMASRTRSVFYAGLARATLAWLDGVVSMPKAFDTGRGGSISSVGGPGK